MVSNVNLKNLHQLAHRKANLQVRCDTCETTRVIDAERFSRYRLVKGWNTDLSTLYVRLRCSRCGARPSRLRATPEPSGPDNFPRNE